jgi:hypothetical protein
MSDTNEQSVASNGSHGEPVAWGVFYGDGKLHSLLDSHAKAECTALTMRKFDHLGVYVSPLYCQPTLTEAEQLAVAWAAREADEWDEEDTPEVAAHADALRGLARRLF